MHIFQINKLAELLSLVPTTSVSKSRVVWRGLLAASLLLLEKGCEVALLGERLSSLITAACHAHTASRDSQHKRWVQRDCNCYSDGGRVLGENDCFS